jgi:hypothetical protein
MAIMMAVLSAVPLLSVCDNGEHVEWWRCVSLHTKQTWLHSVVFPCF